MNEQRQDTERKRRDWIIILIILLIGFLCVIIAGERAARFSPYWKLDTNMQSNLDPDSDFLTNRPVSFYEPLDPAILTQPVWINIFLTPGALFQTRTPVPGTNTPAGGTAIPTLIGSSTPTSINPTNTPTNGPSPTNTPIYYPPPPTITTPKPPSTSTNTPLPSADLAITKTDLNSSYIPGSTITYTIVVVNNGPSGVNGAVITDIFDTTRLNNITWTCSYTGGASSACAGTGNINDSVNLPNSATVTYTVSADVSNSATGTLVNTALVSIPGGYTDPVPGNNSATDTDTLTTTSADLSITKNDVPASATYTPGSAITYSIVVSNPGTSTTAVTGATVTDTFDATRLNTITWTCAYTGGASSTCAGIGNINDSVNLPIGGTVTYTVSANINSGATGNLVNTAMVNAPAGIYDPDTTNNSSTDTNTPAPSADLRITKDDGATAYEADGSITYTINVYNDGPSDVTGARVQDTFTMAVDSINWTCTAFGTGAACGNASGSGDIDEFIDLPALTSVTYQVTVDIAASETNNLTNTATVTAPPGVTDPNTGNNSASDPSPDVLIVSSGTGYVNIGTAPDYSTTTIPEGSAVILSFSSSVIVDNTLPPDGFDLIYYELPNGSGIAMDQVLLEISDGSNWYPIFYWGDNIADTNSNLNINLIGPAENDNRDFSTIPASDVLYPFGTGTLLAPATGVTIELENFVPNGTYLYIRITAMGPPAGDGVEVDAIYVVP